MSERFTVSCSSRVLIRIFMKNNKNKIQNMIYENKVVSKYHLVKTSLHFLYLNTTLYLILGAQVYKLNRFNIVGTYIKQRQESATVIFTSWNMYIWSFVTVVLQYPIENNLCNIFSIYNNLTSYLSWNASLIVESVFKKNAKEQTLLCCTVEYWYIVLNITATISNCFLEINLKLKLVEK